MARPGHRQRLVDPAAKGVAREQPADAVELHQDVRAVVDVGRDLPPAGAVVDVLDDPPAERVVGVGREGRIREVDPDQLILGVVGVGGGAQRRLVGLAGQVAVVVVGIGEGVVLGQPVAVVDGVERRDASFRFGCAPDFLSQPIFKFNLTSIWES